MVDIFIDFALTVNKDENDSIFMSNNGDTIVSHLKTQEKEEKLYSYSYKQYNSLMYHTAYRYCLFLFFLSLSTLSNETLSESTKRVKLKYSFNTIQTNLAHLSIDLDTIYDVIVSNYTPVEYGE